MWSPFSLTALENIHNYAIASYDYFENLEESRLEDEDFVYHILHNRYFDGILRNYIKEVADRAEKYSQFE